jgi:hypothetical protein
MPELVIDFITSLDGYGAADGWPGWWGLEGPEYLAWLGDRFRVVVFPVITGSSGRDRIYDGYPDVSLQLVSNRTFDGRSQLLEYIPTVLAGPPGTSKDDA